MLTSTSVAAYTSFINVGFFGGGGIHDDILEIGGLDLKMDSYMLQRLPYSKTVLRILAPAPILAATFQQRYSRKAAAHES